ncbi:MAG: HD domain-containing phosphohydrolase [Sedimentibacter sp.]
MRRNIKSYKKRSFNYIYKFSMFFILISIAVGLVFFEAVYELHTSNIRQAQEISEYDIHIKDRMKEEVNKAIQIANFYYKQNINERTEEEIKLEVVALLEQITSADVGYFFAADYNGNNVLGPSKGSNFYDIEDKNGLKVVQELIKAAKQGGGYVEYVMPPLDGIEQVPKISYVMPFEPFGWYFGAGVNLYEIDVIEGQIKAERIQKTIQTIISTSILILILMLVFKRINSWLYRKVESEIHLINDYLDKSVNENASLDTTSLNFLELEQIGKHTVSLIEKKNEAQLVLEKTNASLEDEIAEHAKSIELLNVSKKRFESIVKTVPDIIFIMDQNGTFLDCEAGDKLWLNMHKESYLGNNVWDILPEDVASACIKNIQEAIRTNKMQTHEFQLDSGDSTEYFEVRITMFQNNQVFTIMRNVTDIRKIQRTNEYLSYHDQLTGVYNRRYFEEALISLDNPDYLPLAIVMIDVNGLKMTNDAFGHQTGDTVLRHVSEILQKHCTLTGGFVARIGGDEFFIVYPNTNASEVQKIIESIYKSINDERKTNSIISISVGLEIKTSVEQNMTEIFNKAEENLYRVKLTESQSMRHQTVQAILKTLNEKNVREKIHSERVSAISKLIGSAMNLDYSTVKEIEMAGLLHDIGKIAVDENILNKEGKLNDDEYDKIKKHPESSYQILKSINAYAGLAEDVLSHHERWDGKGYPRRLKGEDISLVARIISVADAYEAMTADRSYRLAMTREEAMKELKKHAGTQFDAQIIAIFEEKVFSQV